MSKFGFLGILLVSIAIFGSCSNNLGGKAKVESDIVKPLPETTAQKSYGAYLAGRVAHMRRDFNKASDYYIESLRIDPQNKELVSWVYLILVSQGRVDEAAHYAVEAEKNGDKNNFIKAILAIDEMKKGNYKQVASTLKPIKNPLYKEFINPLITAWAEAALNHPEKALQQLDTLKKEPSFRALYHFHRGMINDYFGRNQAAQTDYEVIVKEESMEMSFRALQIISNFYLRTGQKDKAVALVNKYNDEKLLAEMLEKLQYNVAHAVPEKTAPIITNPNIGVAEALFSIAATLRQGPAGYDMAHMFIGMAIYENPQYDLAKLLLADILEGREMYEDANKIYDSIDKSSEAYYSAQIKKANNYVLMNDNKSAELLLKSLALDSGSYLIYSNLADVLRGDNKPSEAIYYYKKALDNLGKVEPQHWVIYYALGIAYEQNDEWKKAEKSFQKALELNPNNYLVLNYLGYSWIRRGVNTEQAFGMIVEAYNQAPSDGNINDSLGWALYKLGYYRMAMPYIEKAAEIDPSNAVISDHLGDVYWFNGRKNEAYFQWKHALNLKDESNELNKSTVKDKIANGLTEAQEPVFNKEIIEEQIALISKND